MSAKKYINWCIKGVRRKIRKMSAQQKRLIVVAILTFFVGNILGNMWGHAAEEKVTKEAVETAVDKVRAEDEKALNEVKGELYKLQDQIHETKREIPWNMVLVNYLHPMEEGYVPELAELEPGYSVDTRILDAAREMLADAKEAGLQIKLCSAYRSVERQETLFDESMKERVKDGMGYYEAYQETATNVAIPGTSEHALGLALDLISNQYTELDEGQEQTAEAKWLAENCYKYGFILRYPPEKTNITGIIYEPWHYRYVGKDAAKKITEMGVTLEEYMEKYY